MSTVTFDWRRKPGTITTSGGSGEMDLVEGMAEEIKKIIVEPAITNNMYAFELINKDDNNLIEFSRRLDGAYREQVSLPVYGMYKIRITNASQDDIFRVRILYR